MLTLTDITKVFYAEIVKTTALNGVSLSVNDGEFVAIMGPWAVANLPCSTSSASSTIPLRAHICSTEKTWAA